MAGHLSRSWLLVAAASALWSLVPAFASGQPVSFIARRDFPTGAHPGSVQEADFNGDGVLDVVVNIDGGSVSVLLGNGDATFQTPRQSAGGSGSNLAIGDFNRDGMADLVVNDYGSSGVSVH